MVFEPISVVGFIGSASGLVGFIAATFSTIDKRRRDFKDSGDILEWYQTKFKTFYITLDAWTRLWCPLNGEGAYSDQDYVYFWGTDCFNEMQTKFRLIQWEIDKIGNHIYSGLGAERPENTLPSPEAWANWLSERGHVYFQPGTKAVKVRGSLLKALYFSFFKNADLEERIKRLDDKLNDLRIFSKQAFWTAQGQFESINPIAEQDLTLLLKRRNWMQRISTPLTHLYRECQRMKGSWSLVLGAPDDEGGPSSLDEEADLCIEFDTWRMDYEGTGLEAGGILRLYCSQLTSSRMSIKDIVAEIHDNAPLEIPTEWSQSIKDLLSGYVVDTSLDIVQQVDSKITLATTALGLVNWTLLLWRTPWVSDGCTCRIRLVKIDCGVDSYRVPTLTVMPGGSTQLPCHDPNLSLRRVLLLAVSLAELAISKTVRLRVDSAKKVSFIVEGNEYTKEQLLDQVRWSSNGAVAHAVHYCLYYDSKAQSGQWQFREKDIIQFEGEVIDR